MGLLSKLRSWKIIALLVLVAVIAGGAYTAYSMLSGPNSVELEEDQRVIPVQRGDLINRVAVSGSVSFPDSESMTFGTAGTVREVLVQEGQRVQSGDPLASLDPQTVAKLEKEAAQARIDLRAAEEALEDLTSPSDLTIAQARQSVVDAAEHLANAEDALAQITSPSSLAVAQAQSKVTAAELELDAAVETLAETSAGPASLTLAKVEADVAGAELSLQAAQEALSDLQTGASKEDIAGARADVAAAAIALTNATTDLDVIQREWEIKISEATEQLDDAEEMYAAAFRGWLGVEVDPSELDVDYEAMLASLSVDLEEAFGRHNLVYGPLYIEDGGARDDPATPWDEVTVLVWLNLTPFTISPTCDPGDVPPRGKCVEEEFRVFSAAYEDAIDALAAATSKQAIALAGAETSVRSASDTLTLASDLLDELLEPLDPVIAADRAADVELAVAVLEDARATLSELESLDSTLEAAHQQRQVELAQAALDEAKAELEELLSGERHPDYTARSEGVALARLTLSDRQQELAELESAEVDQLELALLETSIASAQAAVDDVQERIDRSTLRSPWDGFVSRINVEPGQRVEPATVVLELVDTSVVEIEGSVDEVDVLSLTVGARAEVTMDALREQSIPGKVTLIGAEPQSQGGVVTYPVSVRLDIPPDLQVPEGLSAIASITISEELDVLLVPMHAIGGSFGRPTVDLMLDGQVVETPVSLGNSDDFWTIVADGLSEGDSVVSTGDPAEEELAGPRGSIRMRRAVR